MLIFKIYLGTHINVALPNRQSDIWSVHYKLKAIFNCIAGLTIIAMSNGVYMILALRVSDLNKVSSMKLKPFQSHINDRCLFSSIISDSPYMGK